MAASLGESMREQQVMNRRVTSVRVLAVCIAVLFTAGTAEALAGTGAAARVRPAPSEPPGPQAMTQAPAPPAPPPASTLATEPEPAAALPVLPTAPVPVPPPPLPPAPAFPPHAKPGAVSLAPGASAAEVLAAEYPAHGAARQIDGEQATFSWAVIIGINDHEGATRDNVASAQDAVLLREQLLSRGWRDDHILVLTDRDAVHDRIVRALEWLARSSDARSRVVFSYSGHTRQRSGDPDGDGEALDEGLWPADNRYLWDADLGRLLGAVQAQEVWITIQACEAAGFADPGMTVPGRLVTWSSREDEKSFEDPDAGFSVQGSYLIEEGFRDGYGDADTDGRVSVQEAAVWAGPRAHIRTAGQQSPQMSDALGRPFFLEIP